HYFTREGVFFQQLHQAMARQNPFPGRLPLSDVLEVSRIATFVPSLREVTPEELMRVWNQYSTQSMGALLRTRDLEVRDYATLLARHGLNPSQVLPGPWADARVRAFLADRELRAKLDEVILVRRRRLVEYLRAHHLTRATPRAAIVDIGWRGTIQ